MHVRVKICGLMRECDVLSAVDHGADALGFIFGYDRAARNLTFEQLKDLISAVPPYVSTVVVSPPSNQRLREVISEIRPSFIQLYGDELQEQDEEEMLAIYEKGPTSVVYCPKVRGDGLREDLQSEFIEKCRLASLHCKAILLDRPVAVKLLAGHTRGAIQFPSNGSGRRVDEWDLSRKVRDALYPYPVILAGGLNEQNVKDAVQTVKPYAVDVSSGVENSPGVKDDEKIRRFIYNAKDV